MATTPNFNWSTPDNTGLVKNGALDIRTLGNAIDASLVDLKGGTTGQVLAKASNTDMDFVWAADAGAPTSLGYSAGKNKIINGDFGIWQRGTSFSSPSSGTFLADRFNCNFSGSGATRTFSQQSFTPGNTISGYESQYFFRFNQSVAGSGGSWNQLRTAIEDVRTFAGQTVTFSFWAKAAASINIDIIMGQNFGSGGSGAVETTIQSSQAITTSWARYTITATIPSISGKTVGAGSYLYPYFGLPSNTTFTFDIWGIQLEAGSTVTAFQTATGNPQGELAACQRYYFRFTADTDQVLINYAYASSTGFANAQIQYPVPMRTVPTSIDSSNLKFVNYSGSGFTMSSIGFNERSATAGQVYGSVSGVTAGHTGKVNGIATGSYIGISAEL